MVDNKENNVSLSPTSAHSQKDVPAAQPENGQQSHESDRKHSRKAAGRIFNAINYIGLGWVANSALSLFITYNAMPTKPAQKLIGLIEKGMKPLIEGWDKLKAVFKSPGAKAISEDLRKIHVTESSRSAAEILIMCIAGCMALIPMKWMEDHKKGIVDKIDRTLNKAHYAKEDAAPKKEEPEPEEPKQTWRKLLTARVLGMGAVLAIDNRIQSFNNHRFDKKLPNLDTHEWKLGAKLYNKLPEGLRERIMNFFSRKGKTVDTIQPLVRQRLADTIGNDAKKMVFAEQTRFLTKEISLTIVTAAVLYLVSKSHFLFGHKNKKDNKEEAIAAEPLLQVEIPVGGARQATFSANIKPKAKPLAPEGLYAHKIAAEAEKTAPGLSI